MEHLSVPGVTFTTADRPANYMHKLQELCSAIDATVTAFNSQVDAAQTAEQIRDATALMMSQVEQIQNDINLALTAAYAAIGTAGDTATYARQLQTSRKIGQKNFNGTTDIDLEISDISGLAARLTEIEIYALGGVL